MGEGLAFSLVVLVGFLLFEFNAASDPSFDLFKACQEGVIGRWWICTMCQFRHTLRFRHLPFPSVRGSTERGFDLLLLPRSESYPQVGHHSYSSL